MSRSVHFHSTARVYSIVKVVVNPLRVLRTGFSGVLRRRRRHRPGQGCQRFLSFARAKSKDSGGERSSLVRFVLFYYLYTFTTTTTALKNKQYYCTFFFFLFYSPNSRPQCQFQHWRACNTVMSLLLRSTRNFSGFEKDVLIVLI